MAWRLKAEIWVKALIRRAQSGGAQAALVKRGDRDGGSMLVRVNLLDGRSLLFSPMTDMNDERVWHARGGAALPNAEIEAQIARDVARDPDVWLVEIEDKQARHFIEERVALPARDGA